jgi:hypothetical protein
VSDFFILALGCFVSLIVASAVGLLLWGAAHEPRAELRPVRESSDTGPGARADRTRRKPTSPRLASRISA